MNALSFRRRAGGALILLGAMAASVAVTSGSASSASPSPIDTSDAIRYDLDGSPIGEVFVPFIDTDDRVEKIDAPFPLNFYGQRLPAVCLSTNGLVYPIASTASPCSAYFDKSLEVLTLLSRASSIAALALDLDPGEQLHNPQRESPDELQVSSVSALGGVLTYTTTSPHGFLVGEQIHFRDNPDFLNAQSGFSNYNGRITGVPTPTTFTVVASNPIPDGTYTPTVGDRATVHRETIMQRISAMTLSGTTLTVTTQSDVNFGAGGKLTFAGTGITGLDGAELTVATRVDATNITVTVPPTLTDIDPSTVGDQATFTPSSPAWALERDEVGAIQQVYFGTTTVDGRDAYSLTWYRMAGNDYSENGVGPGTFPAINPETLSITLQLLIIKRATGSDGTGWDFDYEFNIGHALDVADGYIGNEPVSGCSTSNLAECRWAMGTARYFPGATIATYQYDGTTATFDTAAPHGLAVGDAFTPVGFCDQPPFDCSVYFVNAVVDADTVTALSTVAPEGPSPAPGGSTLGHADSFELFATTPVAQLGDNGGSTALIRNSLNTPVLGRYTFSMIGGTVNGFQVPTMGAGVSGTTTTSSTTTTTAAPTTVAPTTAAPAITAATTPVTTLTPSAPATPTTAALPTGLLPSTGDDSAALLVVAIALMLAGGVLLRFRRDPA
jgi:LPXTG-motif cell wall-anchored protein